MSFRTNDEDDDLEPAHEINVTPFIDVMLVLLIIFMVAAPLATVDAPVDLPASNASIQPRDDAPVYLTVTADGSWKLDDDVVQPATLKAALDRRTQADHERRVLLRGDRSLSYERLMDAMNALRDAGYTHMALVGLERDHG
ncbi:MAG: Biopolymer transport protein ExbD [Luteibacter sp.]|uniref:TonB system transport protein ExbD n=1 Tax=Luteibacter sp. TaxID=1886636 RepID=UPI0013809B6B|nr:TonB system transport protein ExbD [Luteibacter sp.]KAF1005917.1 MAG: Biopolymer transport protein ExbD [Luteibacter sp.]